MPTEHDWSGGWPENDAEPHIALRDVRVRDRSDRLFWIDYLGERHHRELIQWACNRPLVLAALRCRFSNGDLYYPEPDEMAILDQRPTRARPEHLLEHLRSLRN